MEQTEEVMIKVRMIERMIEERITEGQTEAMELKEKEIESQQLLNNI